MSSCQSMSPEVMHFMVFSSFGFKPPASGFQSYSYSSLKTSPSIQVNGEKILHNEGHPEKFTVLHGEEKREQGDRGDQEEKRTVKKGETNLANNQFPKCSPQPGTLREKKPEREEN